MVDALSRSGVLRHPQPDQWAQPRHLATAEIEGPATRDCRRHQDGEFGQRGEVERQHRPDSEFKFASTRLYVHHIAVSQERHRSGIATALMQKVLHLADAADIGEIRLDCWEGNNIAMAFFDAAGFVTTNRLMTRALED